uniref:Uncharacterized protein AlNc14C4G545 n=1 Tax=Albugo laibachii Nc14 TaxID=890382 RepID=F0W0A3_9STRA|nr:conserved hypothetical protein [Albugo laibachii Nc14]|eukprot:CCA14474.1 conserved hypothetical protein [Albugo laibachii Nc14]
MEAEKGVFFVHLMSRELMDLEKTLGMETNDGQHDVSLQRMRMFLKRKENEEKSMISNLSTRSKSERFDGKEEDTRQPRGSLTERVKTGSEVKQSLNRLEARNLPFPILVETSTDWYRIRYLLECALEEYDVTQCTAWRLPSQSVDRRVSDLLTLDSWVLIDDIDTLSENPVEIANTLVQNATPMCVGRLDIPQPIRTDSVYAVLCHIIVGHSYTIESHSSESVLPDGYHSFQLTSTSESNKLNTPAQPVYSHQYNLNHPNQIVPQYVVQFQFRARLSAWDISNCVLCELKPATIRCKSCNAVLCTKCDENVHSANKVVRDHTRVSLPLYVPQPDPDPSPDAIKCFVSNQIEKGLTNVTTPCKEHSDTMMDFFCTMCNVPLCVQCKISGDHSAGENGTHRLISVTNAYENELMESFRPDTLLSTFQESLRTRKLEIQVQQQHVAENHKDVEHRIRQQCQNALEALGKATTEKQIVLRSASLEVERQLDHIAWTEAFFNVNRKRLNALHFIRLWQQHKETRTEQRNGPILNQSHERIVKSVQADSDLSGEITVIRKVDTNETQQIDNKPATETTSIESYIIQQLVKDCCYKPITTQNDLADTEDKYTYSEKGRRLMDEIRHEMLNSSMIELEQSQSDLQQTFVQSLSDIQPLDPLFDLGTLTENQTPNHKRAREVWMELIQNEFGIA